MKQKRKSKKGAKTEMTEEQLRDRQEKITAGQSVENELD